MPDADVKALDEAYQKLLEVNKQCDWGPGYKYSSSIRYQAAEKLRELRKRLGLETRNADS